MKRKNNKQQTGFTLIELMVVVAITSILTVISITNFRAAEKRKRATLAADAIISVLNQAQNYTLTGKNTNNAQVSCRSPQYFYVEFFYGSSDYYLEAMNNCGTVDVMNVYTLPPGMKIKANGLVVDGTTTATLKLKVAYYPPFGRLKSGVDLVANSVFTTAAISVATTDDTITKTVTVDGIVGRILR